MALKPSTTFLFSPRIDKMVPARLEVAFLGMGCFFNAEARLGMLHGVWKTSVGYSGGRSPSPSYEDTGDHLETVMVEYDPLIISYGQLVDLFLLWHSSAPPPKLPQQKPRIFANTETEKRLAQSTIERFAISENSASQTQVSFLKTFYLAEKWCQKYFLRTVPWLIHELGNFYENEDELIHSTLATRLNAYLGQSAPPSKLPDDIEFYDLSEQALRVLRCAFDGSKPYTPY